MYGDNMRRDRTPLSASPSPEPPSGHAGEQRLSAAIATTPQPGAVLPSAKAGGASGRMAVPSGGVAAGAMTADTPAEDGGEAAYGDPAQESARQVLEERIRMAIDDLMQLATCAAEVHKGDERVIQIKINETMESLQAIQDATNFADLRHMVPEDVMGMIDTGRNPDVHTRSMTNRLNSDNQQMRGQAQNFDRYSDRLRDKLSQAFPEMQSDLEAP